MNFCRHFTDKQSRLTLSVVRFSKCIHITWWAFLDEDKNKVCRKMCPYHKISCIQQGNKGFAHFHVNFVRKKIPRLKTLHHFPLVKRKCCYLPGKLEIKVCNYFCLHDWRSSCHFFQLQAFLMRRELKHGCYTFLLWKQGEISQEGVWTLLKIPSHMPRHLTS